MKNIFKCLLNRKPAKPPKKGVLVYVGLHKGAGFKEILGDYEVAIGFEADPILFEELKTNFCTYDNVELVNAAAAEKDGEIDFNISSNGGASSSIGQFNDNWESFKSGEIKMDKTITVKSVNLLHFLQAKGITKIRTYVSDIQGMDLTVLKTLKPMIDEGMIEEIISEVGKDQKVNIYKNIPSNDLSGFNELLKNYKMVATGWGKLKNGKFKDVPEEWCEMDCKWVLNK